MSLLDLRFKHRLPVIRQSEAAECGLACLAMVASYYGRLLDLNTLRRTHPVSLNGVTLRALMLVASQLHLLCRPLRFELEDLGQLRRPAILHWDMNHFVVLKSVSRKGIVVHDPAAGEKTYSMNEASNHLTGVALELMPTEGFSKKDDRSRLPFSAFWSHLSGYGHVLTQVLVLSIILQALALAAPFYMQLTIDEVIARGDIDLLLVLALGFALLMAIKTATAATRSVILLYIQNVLHFHLGARLFHHMIRLPLAFFEKRQIGDVLSRFTSLQPIRNLLGEGLIASALDGVMAVATLIMILIYSPILASVVLIAFFLYAVVRLGLYRVIWLRTEATIQAQAQESSTFIESLRAIQSLKLFNREDAREGQWLNRYNEVASTNVHLGRSKIAFTTINDVIFGMENIVTIYLAARLALNNTLTVGMIFAFMSYKQNFTEKAVQLVEKAIDVRVLGLHLERLADIALTPPDAGHVQSTSYVGDIEGRIELRSVHFRYSENDPLVLEDINLKIEAGEFVNIVGPSGGGKTTLVKLMLGLLEPTEGEIWIDGMPLTPSRSRAYRDQVGAVMQEDQLLSGSIADNICFFDPDFDHSWMLACAQLANIHEEIMAMPMTYNSLVGDMGSSLSGGQKQRLLLARALYKRPRILFLDEGTAHLDLDNERHIHRSLTQLQITRISVAHRPDIATGADRVIRIARRLSSDTPRLGRILA